MVFILNPARFAPTGVSIEKSALFSASSSSGGLYYTTDGSGFNQKTFTLSTWFYLGKDTGSIGGVGWPIFAADHGSANSETTWWKVRINTDGTLVISNWNDVVTSQVFRDAGFYHLVIGADTTQSSASDRYKVWVNGVRVTAFGTTNYPSQDIDLAWGEASEDHWVGGYDGSSYAYNGYLAETVYKSGSQLDADQFGSFDSTNQYWTPLSSDDINALSPSWYLDNSVTTPADTTSSIIDHSSTGHTITAGGNVAHSTTETKVNPTSIKFDGTTDYLKWAQSGHADFTFGTGDFCIEGWFLRAHLSGTSNYSYIIDFRYSGNNSDRPAIYMDGSNNIHYDFNNIKITSSTDPSLGSWFHLAVARNSGTTTMYLNGTSVGSFSDSTSYLVGRPWLGEYPQSNAYCLNGYMDEVRISKGVARYTANFTPSTTPHTIDSDTVFLVAGIRNYGAGTDATSNSIDMINSGVTISTHTPTNISGLINPLYPNVATLSNGNKTVTSTGTSDQTNGVCTVPCTEKVYFEFEYSTVGTHPSAGIVDASRASAFDDYVGGNSTSWGWHLVDGNLYNGGSVSASTPSTLAVNTRGCIAFDVDTGKMWTGQLSGSTVTWDNSGNPATAANPITSSISTSTKWFPIVSGRNSCSISLYTAEDDLEISAIPTGFKTPITANLPVPSEVNIDEYLNIQTWAGNATDGRAITTGFDTDFAAIKRTNTTGHWVWADSVRGNGKSLYSNDTDVETTDDGSGHVNTFTDTGVTIDDQARTNASGHNYWGMFLKAGGAPTATNSEAQGAAPTSGSYMIDGSASSANTIGTADITKLSVNTTLGFSVGTYNGSNSDTLLQTGLTDCSMVIIKRLNATYNWAVWHKDFTDDHSLFLNTASTLANNSYFDTSENTSTLFQLEGNSNATSIAGGEFVFYAFTSSSMISVGSYVGNESLDGTFVPTLGKDSIPIQPVFVMVKNTVQARSWNITDTVRNSYNVANYILEFDSTTGQQTGSDTLWNMDIVTGGFKLRSSHETSNGAETLVYLAIGSPIISKTKEKMAGR